jgi:hypothetical protein
MVYLLVILGVGTGIAACCAEERGMRLFFILCCLGNLWAAADMVASHYPYAWHLKPRGAPTVFGPDAYNAD